MRGLRLRFALAATSAWLCAASLAQAQDLTLEGLDGRAHTLTPAELAAMPHASAVLKTEDGRTLRYDGVALTTLLQQVGAPAGKALRGADLADVALVTASDGYRVAIGLAEADASIGARTIVLADRLDGAPLPPHDGPYRLVVEGDGRPARAARMVVDVRLVRVTIPPPG